MMVGDWNSKIHSAAAVVDWSQIKFGTIGGNTMTKHDLKDVEALIEVAEIASDHLNRTGNFSIENELNAALAKLKPKPEKPREWWIKVYGPTSSGQKIGGIWDSKEIAEANCAGMNMIPVHVRELTATDALAQDELAVVKPAFVKELLKCDDLMAENAKLREALKPFDAYAKYLDDNYSEHTDETIVAGFLNSNITFEDFRKVRAALIKETP